MTDMTPQQAAKKIYGAVSSAEQVDKIFEALKTESADFVKQTVDCLEAIAVEDMKSMAQEYKSMLPMLRVMYNVAAGQESEEDKQADIADMKADQATAQIFLRIQEIKGAAADPLTKAVVKEMSTLSDKEYNHPSGLKIIAAFVRAYDSLSAGTPPQGPTPGKNPFRKGPGQ